MSKETFGVIIGNRFFFPDALAKESRKGLLGVLKDNGFGSVSLSMKETKFTAVETFSDAKKCASLFTDNAGNISFRRVY